MSGQSRPFWAVLKLLKNSNMKFELSITLYNSIYVAGYKLEK